jgi:hypothetical protein
MKKVIILGLFMALLTTTQAQISFSVPMGVSTLKAPTIGVNLQVRMGGLILAAGFDNQMGRDIMKGNLVWTRVGGAFSLSELNALEISAGVAQHRRSSDIKSLNEGLALVNVQYVHTMASRPEAALFASVTGTQKFAIITGGLRFTFGKGERRGCSSTWRR